MLVIVINCLRLSVVVIYCYHGDGSDGRHVYHGHTHYLLVHMLEVVIICLRLFNPRRACARVTVLVLCVCVCVCLFPL